MKRNDTVFLRQIRKPHKVSLAKHDQKKTGGNGYRRRLTCIYCQLRLLAAAPVLTTIYTPICTVSAMIESTVYAIAFPIQLAIKA